MLTTDGNPNFYKEYPKSCARDDFWGQVKRTVNGTSVSQDQIDMIVQAIRTGLSLSENDRLLDLCCGNGALSRYLFSHCAGGIGVDYSEHLISVAKEYFESAPREIYKLCDVVEYLETEIDTHTFTKALCYGSFQYLSIRKTHDLLSTIRNRFKNIGQIFIGNVPDKSQIKKYYKNKEYKVGSENDHTTMIGIWWTIEDFISMASKCGWDVTFTRMPDNFYAAHYRFDATLARKGNSL